MPTRTTSTSTFSVSSDSCTWSRWRTRDRAGGSCRSRAIPTRRPATLGVTDNNVNPPVHPRVAAAPNRRTARQPGVRRLQRTAREVPASICEQFLDAHVLHLRAVRGLQLRQRRTVTLTNVYDTEYDRGPGTVRRDAHLQLDGDLRDSRGPRQRLYGGWQVAGALYLRSGLPINITTTQNILSTTVGQTARLPGRGRIRPAMARSRTRPSIDGSTPRASST